MYDILWYSFNLLLGSKDELRMDLNILIIFILNKKILSVQGYFHKMCIAILVLIIIYFCACMRKLFTKIFVSFRMQQSVIFTYTNFRTYTEKYKILYEASTHISGKSNLRTGTHHLTRNQIRSFTPANDYTYDNKKDKNHRKEVDTYKEKYSDHSFLNIFLINSC